MFLIVDLQKPGFCKHFLYPHAQGGSCYTAYEIPEDGHCPLSSMVLKFNVCLSDPCDEKEAQDLLNILNPYFLRF